MTASLLTAQCTRTVDDVYQANGTPQRVVAVSSPVSFSFYWPCISVRGPVEKEKDPELVGTCDRYLKGLL